jgi:hypothetical protein
LDPLSAGHFPIANLDAPATVGRDVIERRRRDLLADWADSGPRSRKATSRLGDGKQIR